MIYSEDENQLVNMWIERLGDLLPDASIGDKAQISIALLDTMRKWAKPLDLTRDTGEEPPEHLGGEFDENGKLIELQRPQD